jgi:hypothetical protein
MSGAPQSVRDRAIKLAARELVHAVGGQEAAAQLIGKSQSQVQRCCSINDDSNFLNARDIGVLEQYAPRPLVTMALAKLAGGVFLALPDPAIDQEDLALKIVNIADELGDVSHVVRDALKDAHVDSDEAEEVERELDQLIEVALAARSHVQMIQGKEPTAAMIAASESRERGRKS